MATISELAQMSSNVYDGTSLDVLLKNLTNWKVIENSNSLDPSFANQGYFGVAYQNTVTGEVVIANRGTDVGNGVATAFRNLLSDGALALNKSLNVQGDAAAFAKQVVDNLNAAHTPFTSLIETGHSLGGTEAQAAVARLVDRGILPATQISGVVFNSPGIAGFHINLDPTDYNVLDLFAQGDAVHLAGGTHLGGAGNLAMLAAGPNTAALSILAPAAIAAGPVGVLGLLGAALYDVVGPAHSINTIINYIATMAGSATGTFNWTSSSSASLVPRTSVNPLLPAYSVNSSGNLVLTDPVSGVTATFSIPSINGTTISATFSGGTSAIAQALDSLGVVTVPLSQLGQNLTSVAGASLLAESITRNSSDNFDVTFQNSGSPSPNGAAQFAVTATNSGSAFDYTVPAPSQTLVEIIDNGVGNATGSVVVLGSSATTLTGGSAVPGVTDKWVDTINGYQYEFEAASADSDQGTLVVTNGLLGTGGNQIVINNFGSSGLSVGENGVSIKRQGLFS